MNSQGDVVSGPKHLQKGTLAIDVRFSLNAGFEVCLSQHGEHSCSSQRSSRIHVHRFIAHGVCRLAGTSLHGDIPTTLPPPGTTGEFRDCQTIHDAHSLCVSACAGVGLMWLVAANITVLQHALPAHPEVWFHMPFHTVLYSACAFRFPARNEKGASSEKQVELTHSAKMLMICAS